MTHEAGWPPAQGGTLPAQSCKRSMWQVVLLGCDNNDLLGKLGFCRSR